jgi:type VI protein secretion system component VasK
VRFPFTFLGFLALAIGVWVIVYLAAHRSLDPGSQELAVATAVVSLGFGLYVLIRRVIRGPQP